ncbi:hypothetical protein [Curtobacterium luteum]|nr:hypothetical protein [Curtobacterium luteum]
MPNTETITDVTRRIRHQIDEHALKEIGKVILDIRDVERLIHAAIWGDD